jgi:hypothetical protein
MRFGTTNFFKERSEYFLVAGPHTHFWKILSECRWPVLELVDCSLSMSTGSWYDLGHIGDRKNYKALITIAATTMVMGWCQRSSSLVIANIWSTNANSGLEVGGYIMSWWVDDPFSTRATKATPCRYQGCSKATAESGNVVFRGCACGLKIH